MIDAAAKLSSAGISSMVLNDDIVGLDTEQS